ncbi:Beta-lactamase/transpeptidase-like protein [Rhypophila sp. PSN 637]
MAREKQVLLANQILAPSAHASLKSGLKSGCWYFYRGGPSGHRGSVVYKEIFGYRDVESRIKGDDDTGFTAEAVAILVEEGKLKWTTPVKDIVPGIHPNDETIYNHANMVNLLSHRTGLERTDSFWAQSNNNILLEKHQALRTNNQLRAVTAFRGEYRYNNWDSEIAGRVIENPSGKQYSKSLSDKIFKPLGMSPDNVAKGNMTFDNASPCPVPRPHMAEGTRMNPAGGIQSTVNDLLIYYSALVRSLKDQQETGKTSTPRSPLKQVLQVLSSNIRTALNIREQSYAMGPRFQKMPMIGNPEQPCLALYHHGMLVGFNNAVYIFPETETVALLLSNAVAINDGPDWIGHLIIQTLFDDPVKHDHVALARGTH